MNISRTYPTTLNKLQDSFEAFFDSFARQRIVQICLLARTAKLHPQRLSLAKNNGYAISSNNHPTQQAQTWAGFSLFINNNFKGGHMSQMFGGLSPPKQK
jgi:hypothetical protein